MTARALHVKVNYLDINRETRARSLIPSLFPAIRLDHPGMTQVRLPQRRRLLSHLALRLLPPLFQSLLPRQPHHPRQTEVSGAAMSRNVQCSQRLILWILREPPPRYQPSKQFAHRDHAGSPAHRFLAAVFSLTLSRFPQRRVRILASPTTGAALLSSIQPPTVLCGSNAGLFFFPWNKCSLCGLTWM